MGATRQQVCGRCGVRARAGEHDDLGGEVAGNDAQCVELAALLARRASARTVTFGGDVNRRRPCAPDGVWARTDDTRGVWKAPANDTMRGVLDIERSVTQNEQSLLNPIGINCIRPFGTRGIRIWGARTLASDTDWNYINVRRLFNMVESTILEGTQYAVFEPNDMSLWEGVNRTVSGFLRGLWTAGALSGLSADEAFYVKCDAETNPPEVIEAGQVICEIGIAPVKPAEFVVFRLSQFSGGDGAEVE